MEYPVYFVKFLQTWFENQNMRIKWNNRLSEPFGARNGVRQGSVLSPSLFNIYIDDLLHQLEKSGDVARVCGVHTGALANAGDITLVSPTVSGLQRILNICGSYAESHSLVFNCQKSKAMIFSRKRQRYVNDPSFVLNGNLVSCTQSIIHLGVVLNNVGRDDNAVDDRIRRFSGAVNTSVARLGGKCFSELAWTTIMDAALFPILTYGSHLCYRSRSTIAQSVNQSYRKGIRRGLCMRNRELGRDSLGEWFVEGVEKVNKLKLYT